MIDTHEPKDGDFIAYIEQLQKESAARLLGSGHPLINQLESSPAKGANKAGSHFFAGRKPADLRSAAQLQASLAPVVARASLGRLFSSLLSIAIGVLLALYWLIASASVATLVVGIAFIFWGLQRIRRAMRQLSPQQSKQTQALISKVFSTADKTK